MAFTTPTFNLTVNVWRSPHNPLSSPPDVVLAGNLSQGRRVTLSGSPFGEQGASRLLLLPKLSDVRASPKSPAGPGSDIVEVPAGTGRYYSVADVDDVAKGFANEYRVAVLNCEVPIAWPVPYP